MKNMTPKTKAWFVVNSILITIIVLVTIYLSEFCELITIPYLGVVSKVALWAVSTLINITIAFWFCVFWWCENRWRNIKNKFRRRG